MSKKDLKDKLEEETLLEEKEGEALEDEVIEDLEIEEPLFVQAEITYEEEQFVEIEKAREIFLKQYKSQNVIKWIVSIAALALIIVGWLIFLDKSIYLTIGSIALSLLLILGYNFIIKRYLNGKMKTYFDVFYNNTTSYIFDENKYEDVKSAVENKIEPVQFIENNIYKDVVQVGSRNLTTYEYKKMTIQVCDAAGQVKAQKGLKPVFVGKYFMAPNLYKGEEPIIIYLKGNEKSLPPTNIEHLNVISDDKVMAVYSNNDAASKFLTKQVMSALKKIKTDDVLIDVAISIQKEKTFVCAGYDDTLMVLPLEHPFDPKPTKNYKEDLEKFSEFIYALNTKPKKE
ncbi:MAG: hypothetical protein WCZ47_04555 [Bacilli bacterium]|jgi:hypothetical protein|nr:hypothetical protein [Bacilli bacterium]